MRPRRPCVRPFVGGNSHTMGAAHPLLNPPPPSLHATQSFIPHKGGAWGVGRGEQCGWTPFLRPSSVRLPFEGVKGAWTAHVASALLPICASLGRGCEHDPTHHPARPTPAPHLLQSTVHAHKRWDAGVVHAERMWGRAHTQCVGAPAPLRRPFQFTYLWAWPHCTHMGAW